MTPRDSRSGRVPGPRARGPGLPRLGRDVADAAAGDRGDGRATTPSTARSIHRGVYPLAARGDRGLRGRARDGRRVRRLDARRDDLHAQRDRGDQPRRLLVGPRQRRRGRPRGASRRWSTTPTSCRGSCCAPDGRGARLRAGRRRRPARPRRARRRCSRAGRSSSPSPTSPTCSARSTRSPRSSRRAHAAGAVVVVDGTQAVAAPAGRRRRARRRLLRLDRPQGLRADRHRRAARPPRAARGDAAVPRRRAHDRPRRRRRAPRAPSRPRKFEAGTMPIAEAIGLGAAVDFLSGIGMDAVWEHSRDVVGYALERLRRGARARRSTARRDLAHRGALCVVRARRRPPARRRRDPRPRGRLRARRPPLRAAADAPPRRAGHARAPRSPCTPRARTSTGWSTASDRVREVFACMDDLYRENILEHYKQPASTGASWTTPTSSSRTSTRSAATS